MSKSAPETGENPLSLSRYSGQPQVRAEAFRNLCQSVCELASGVFELPMAVIKVGDGAAMKFGGACGFPAGTELDDLRFCERKLVANEGLVVTDATRDARYFLESPVLNTPKIRFYVDMPLVIDGVVMGVLAMCQGKPRFDFDDRKLRLLRLFANQSASLLALAQGAAMRGDIISELQSRQDRMDMAADLSGIGYWKIDLKTREVSWSKGLYAIYGLNPTAYKPQVANQLDIFEPEDNALVIDHFQRAVNEGVDFDFNVRILNRKDKTTRLIRTKGGVERDSDGTATRLCAVVQDISGGTVAPSTPHLTVDINTAKNAFLSHITDGLKAPLDDILTYARLLNDPRQRDTAAYSEGLLKSAQSLQNLIGGTLEAVEPVGVAISDGSDGKYEEDLVDVAALIKAVMNGFASQASHNRTRLTIQFVDFDTPCAALDAMRLTQVLQNLLSNACKFTHNGSITIAVSQINVASNHNFEPDMRLHISVRDSGVGMSDEKVAAVFAPQSINGEREGLGLSIAKTIVERMGGHIGVLSRPGEGSNFWFEIPVEWVRSNVAAKAHVNKAQVDKAQVAKVQVAQLQAAQLQAERTVTPEPVLYAQPSRAGAYTPRPLRHVPLDPMRPDVMAKDAIPRYATVDEDRINREYLRALLHDMKLDLQ